MEEAQTYLDHWEARWADTRIHGTTKRQVAAMFAEENIRSRRRRGEEFGSGRIQDILLQNGGRSLADLTAAIFAAAEQHGPQHDDQTLVLVRASGPGHL